MKKTLLAFSFVASASVNASLIELPDTGIGHWKIDQNTNETLVEFGRFFSGNFSHNFNLDQSSFVTIVADDCCAGGDVYGLILDNKNANWIYTDLTNSVNGDGLFHGVFTGFLDKGSHSFSFNVEHSQFEDGGMSWGIGLGKTLPDVMEFTALPIPEPSTYAMLLTGLGIIMFKKRIS